MQTPAHFFGYSTRMTADYCGYPYELVIVDEEMANDAAFKAKKGHHNFPIAELPDGTIISQSAAIAAYIAREAGNQQFLGETAMQAAEVEQWIDITQSTIMPAVALVGYTCWGHKKDKEAFEKSVTTLKDSAKQLDKALEGKYWLVGGTFTLADVCVFNSLIIPFSFVLDAGFRKACLPNLTAY